MDKDMGTKGRMMTSILYITHLTSVLSQHTDIQTYIIGNSTKIGVSNIIERQRYTTVNKLTPVSKKRAGNDNMIIIEDEPKPAQPKKQKNKTKPVVQLFVGNCSSLSAE